MTSGEAVRLQVQGRDDVGFWRALEALLNESFEADARRPITQIRALAPLDPGTPLESSPRFVGAYLDDRLVAFAVIECLVESRALYLWYLATTPGLRGHGIGARLLAWVDGQFDELVHVTAVPPVGIVVEAEAPAPDAGAADDDVRRVAFYERHGYRVLPVEEAAPPFAPQEADADMFWLLVKPRPGLTVDDVAADDVIGILADIYSGSVLNGPCSPTAEHLAFARTSWGRAPRDAEAMRAGWSAFVSRG